MRRVQAAPPRATGYPRLKQAWRVLVGATPLVFGAGVARGDASTPPCGNKNQSGDAVRLAPMPIPPRVKGDMPAPKPIEPPPATGTTQGAVRPAPPPLGGEPARPMPVRAPDPPLPPGLPPRAEPPRPKTPEPQKARPPEPQKARTLVPAPPVRSEPQLDGVIGRRVVPPDARGLVIAIVGEPDEGTIMIHPHGPDEPCRRRG